VGLFSGITEFLFGVDEPEVPGLDPTSQAIQQQQLKTLQQSTALQKAFLPFQLAELGFARGDDGKLRQMTEEERLERMTPEQRRAFETQQLFDERLLSALQGETTFPGLERDILRGETLLEEDIARRGQMGGTAEAQREAGFQESALISRDEARRAEIANLTGVGTGFNVAQQSLMGNQLSLLSGLSQGGLPFISAAQQSLIPGLQQQQLGFQGALSKQQADAALMQSLIPNVGISL
jgi:hypothetical protein